jgi:hypothetical protein
MLLISASSLGWVLPPFILDSADSSTNSTLAVICFRSPTRMCTSTPCILSSSNAMLAGTRRITQQGSGVARQKQYRFVSSTSLHLSCGWCSCQPCFLNPTVPRLHCDCVNWTLIKTRCLRRASAITVWRLGARSMRTSGSAFPVGNAPAPGYCH